MAFADDHHGVVVGGDYEQPDASGASGRWSVGPAGAVRKGPAGRRVTSTRPKT